MPRYDSCLEWKGSCGCTPQAIQTVQPFPEAGLLADNTNKPLADLKRQCKVSGPVCSYVLSSIKLNRNRHFEQHGCGPNFQGGFLTLCTCKHQMRSSQTVDQWQKDVWIAGFTSRSRKMFEGTHWLFFLARIESAHESHADLWYSMAADVRQAKAAHIHFLGDIFKPKRPRPTGNSRFAPGRYHMPTLHAHRTDRNRRAWHKDINYRHAVSSRRAPLLVADPRLTFMWKEPMIFLTQKHCRDYAKWRSLRDLLDRLRDVT